MALETVLLALGPGDADRTDELTSLTTDIAGPTDATVVLAHVFTASELENVASRLDFKESAEVSPDDVAARLSYIREIRNRLEDADIDHRIESRTGEHGDSIVTLAREERADLVFVGGRKRSPTGKAVFGSTAQKVLLDAPCPVTFVRGN